MDKSFVKTFLLLLFVSIVFMIFSILLYFFKNSSGLLKNKLKTGALVISLSASLSGCTCPGAVVTCYEPMPPPPAVVFSDGESHIITTPGSDINGKISYAAYDQYHYAVVQNGDDKIFQSGLLYSTDSTSNSAQTENIPFSLIIDSSVPPGEYELKFYYSGINDDYLLNIYQLTLIQEE